MEKHPFYDALDATLEVIPAAKLAKKIKSNERNVRRWANRECLPRDHEPLIKQLQQLYLPYIPKPKKGDFAFIDLFAGIGGLRWAFESIGGECVFTSEWDSYAQRTYHTNFPDEHPLNGDITKVNVADIPDHDVLLAGFPCQPFSIAGVSKKNALGRSHGFLDETQGTLFFDVARIIAHKKPKAFLLENVKNLQSHDKGKTFEVIRNVLENDLKYRIHIRVIDGQHFVPQHRERIAIVGFRERDTPFTWDALRLPRKGLLTMKDILHSEDGTEPVLNHDEGRYVDARTGKVHDKYVLSDKLWNYLKAYAEKHRAAGNGFGFGLVGPNDIARTLSARYYKDGSEILVNRGPRKNPRRLTPRECARLMGFPDSFKIPVSDTRAYKQFGNSVVMPVFKEVAHLMRPFLIEKAATSPKKKRKLKSIT